MLVVEAADNIQVEQRTDLVVKVGVVPEKIMELQQTNPVQQTLVVAAVGKVLMPTQQALEALELQFYAGLHRLP